MKKFLVIQTAFIGDAILATAVLESLSQIGSEAQIDLLVRKGNEGLFEYHPFIHELLIWDKNHRKYANVVSLMRKIRKNKYDVVINLQRFFTTGMLLALSGAKERVGFKKNPLSALFTKAKPHLIAKGVHEVDRNHSLVEDYVGANWSKPRLYPQDIHINRIESYLQNAFITFSPASVWFTKQYPKGKWIELLSVIPKHIRIIALGSKNDFKFSQEILDEVHCDSAFNLCGELNLLESAALMTHAKMNFVNDSAPLHLASAMDAPVCAIFCSTIREFGFGPLSKRSWFIETKEELKCRPCGLHGLPACPEKHFKCAETIAIEQFKSIITSL